MCGAQAGPSYTCQAWAQASLNEASLKHSMALTIYLSAWVGNEYAPSLVQTQSAIPCCHFKIAPWFANNLKRTSRQGPASLTSCFSPLPSWVPASPSVPLSYSFAYAVPSAQSLHSLPPPIWSWLDGTWALRLHPQERLHLCLQSEWCVCKV